MSLTISCDDCRMEGTSACAGCVVSFICGREPHDAVIIDAAEERAVRLLGRSGLVPPLRHDPLRHDPLRHDPLRHDPLRHDPLRHDPLRRIS